ncbi:hypothetical protein GWI33_001143 [Rhynchophorus ferrugineus]|uniref:Uncharacterized protein n=1 Tax=Rhynchophorus ferrugineus TaxID=354439 RepID=A0A834IQJ6_RHYFE|nr:hypothetical protein GWI33_001143 [Rhynchophorus ferrugineus]
MAGTADTGRPIKLVGCLSVIERPEIHSHSTFLNDRAGAGPISRQSVASDQRIKAAPRELLGILGVLTNLARMSFVSRRTFDCFRCVYQCGV